MLYIVCYCYVKPKLMCLLVYTVHILCVTKLVCYIDCLLHRNLKETQRTCSLPLKFVFPVYHFESLPKNHFQVTECISLSLSYS